MHSKNASFMSQNRSKQSLDGKLSLTLNSRRTANNSQRAERAVYSTIQSQDDDDDPDSEMRF